jgi:hypothetical protein
VLTLVEYDLTSSFTQGEFGFSYSFVNFYFYKIKI